MRVEGLRASGVGGLRLEASGFRGLRVQSLGLGLKVSEFTVWGLGLLASSIVLT